LQPQTSLSLLLTDHFDGLQLEYDYSCCQFLPRDWHYSQ